MYTEKNGFIRSALIAVLFLSTVVACRHDKVADTNSPAYHIAESQKLILPHSVELPDNLPNGYTRVATYFAEGVQKYKAQLKAGSNPATYEWVFVAPKADLYDATNLKIGIHYAGPTWRLENIGSDSIVAQQFSPVRSAASNEPNTIDWLQLMPKVGKTPSGIFLKTTYIQRIATKGGKAPTALPLSATDTVDVKYTAIYRFSEKN